METTKIIMAVCIADAPMGKRWVIANFPIKPKKKFMAFLRKENPQIRNKIRNLRKSIDEILGSEGIVYLLSTRPHTTGSSNFVKLVKNKVVGNDELINYFKGENASYDPTAVRNSLMRYLKLTKRKEDDTDAATPEEQQLRRRLHRYR